MPRLCVCVCVHLWGTNGCERVHMPSRERIWEENRRQGGETNLFGHVGFIPVAIGFTGQNGMWPSERYFDPSSRLTVLLEELRMAQGVFYGGYAEPTGSLHKIIKNVRRQ